EDDEYPITEGTIDLEPLIRDAVLLMVPFAPLCTPQCLGLCERCGGDRNLGECSCGPEPDARWEALATLRFPDSERDRDMRERTRRGAGARGAGRRRPRPNGGPRRRRPARARPTGRPPRRRTRGTRRATSPRCRTRFS